MSANTMVGVAMFWNFVMFLAMFLWLIAGMREKNKLLRFLYFFMFVVSVLGWLVRR